MKKPKHITQHMAIFYVLYKAYKNDSSRFVSIPDLIGEVYIKEFDIWVFISYEANSRMSELKSRNPTLFEGKMIKGRSGAQYGSYRLVPGVSQDFIRDPKLSQFYFALREAQIVKNVEIVDGRAILNVERVV